MMHLCMNKIWEMFKTLIPHLRVYYPDGFNANIIVNSFL